MLEEYNSIIGNSVHRGLLLSSYAVEEMTSQ